MLDRVELQYIEELPFPVRRVEDALVGSPETWILKPARQAGRRGDLLLSEVGFGAPGRGVRKNVLIEVGQPYRLASKTILPLTWRGHRAAKAVPGDARRDRGPGPRRQPHPALVQRPVRP